MIDPLKATRDYLVADAGLTAQTSTRIYAGRTVPPPDYQPADGGALTFNLRGGRPTYDDDHLLVSAQFKCYGADELAAMTVYRALHDALQNARGAEVRWARAESMGQSLNEPDTGWPFVLAFYEITLIT